MNERGHCWLVEDNEPAMAVPGTTNPLVTEALPDQPWDLSSTGLRLFVHVDGAAAAAAVVEAVLRGVDVMVTVDGRHPDLRARLGDDLDRLGCRMCEATFDRDGATHVVPDLTSEQHELLSQLAEGMTVAAAARSLGIAPRTAARRLEAARHALGAQTTTEAVLLARAELAGLPAVRRRRGERGRSESCEPTASAGPAK